ncbi:hypothetical protein VN1338_45770 [Helicobacter pylori]
MSLSSDAWVNLHTLAGDLWSDGRCFVTRDRRPSAHFFFFFFKQKTAYEILTLP